MDPNRLDKPSKQLNLNNTANNLGNMEQPQNELKIPQQMHQHNTPTLYYYPMVHQHHQIYNKQQHQHHTQSPLLFSISPGNQLAYSNTPHRYFQHYPQFQPPATHNESIYSAHHHPPREPSMNQITPEQPSVHQVSPQVQPQPPQTLDLQQRNQVNQVPLNQLQSQVQNQIQPDIQKDIVQPKSSSPKTKAKEAEKIQLKSPAAKRPENAPVTTQGWLYKQGSEGLMLWKKRWFVLSEFCLFYYKNSTEDKVLGSILLPSYKVSVCGADDRVNRKHAFKCEHVNMRTYILAADSHELMMQWIHVLSLACNLQTTTSKQSEQSKTTPNNASAQHIANIPAGQTMVYSNGPATSSNRNVRHTHTPSNVTDFSNSSQQELGQYNQPLYANAPPKPRRVADGFCSPGPEIIDRGYSPHQAQSQTMTPRNMAKSPSFSPSNQTPQLKKPDRLLIHPQHTQALIAQNVDRRTPDTYGRSKTIKSPRNPSDYEDIYNQQEMYKRPLSPGEIEIRSMKGYPNTNYKLYPSVNLRPRDFVPYDGRSPSAVPRPHSADFLEHRVQDEVDPVTIPKTQPMRPKSSLDINMHMKEDYSIYDKLYSENIRPKTPQHTSNVNNDNYFYSQERYAEKMRKSAQYLQKLPLQYSSNESANRKPNNRRTIESPMSYNTAGSFGLTNYQQPVRSRSALSDKSHLCTPDMENESFRMDYPLHIHGDQNIYTARSMAPDQFIRSASARLAPVPRPDMSQSDSGHFRQDGERKREESMKRLLEWKQRMLQSPLNRKAQGYRSNFGKEPNCIPYANASSYVGEKKTKKMGATNVRKPAPAHTIQYNSYSSDDEENGKSSKTNTMNQAQAGRTLETTVPSESSLALAYVDSVTAVPEETPVDDCQNVNLQPIEDITAEIKTSGELVKAILSEFQDPQEDNAYEENYMPMSPKKCILQPRNGTTIESALITETEENHYVEMTQGNVDSNFKMQNNPDGQYEMVYFKDDKNEPVYMELRGLNKNRDLPDILSPSQTSDYKESKPNDSDTDDESSKNVSSDNQNKPNTRLSLSDTFRPASYYLGVSKSGFQDLQDSSDSELVSPPPIPTSSPHLRDEGSIRSDRKSSDKFRYIKKDSETCSDINSDHTGRPISASSQSQLNFSVTTHDDLDNSILDDTLSEIERLSESNRNIPDYENFFIAKKILQGSASKSASPSLDSLRPRGRPESASSTSAEINSFLINSNRSTPLINTDLQSGHSHSNSEEIHISAPYYYSDICENISFSITSRLSTLTLNNQRESICGSKRDISRIINPIKGTENFVGEEPESHTQKLAAEARSVSVEFLNFTDKSENIDKKNIYESDTLKRQKGEENVTMRKTNPKERNVYPFRSSNKFETKSSPMKKSLSLEGILENVLNESTTVNETHRRSVVPESSEGSYLWEEDSVWRERLRTASQRHSKSMDDLDCIDVLDTETGHKKVSRGIKRYVTYVNDNFSKPEKINREGSGKSDSGIKKKGSFLIDRETLRQWDLMSSAPSDDKLLKLAIPETVTQGPSSDTVTDHGEGSCDLEDTTPAPYEEASGSISINTREATALGRDTFPRSGSTKKPWNSKLENTQTHSVADFNQFPKYGYDRAEDLRRSLNDLTVHSKMNLSAGQLLGRTHEELVLLLIQLRRQQSQTFQAIESCYNEIDTIQVQMQNMDQMRRIETLQKLDRIKQNLIDLEDQYEKGKPLVNLVDNMVKLGSLYKNPRQGVSNNDDISRLIRERMQFNQQLQEIRLLEDEKRGWDRIEPSPFQLQGKVKQLYQLDSLIKEESRNLHNLQRDKEDIEQALGGLRNKLIQGYNNPAEMEQARRQQITLENELSRVHFMLAQNSKRLEETVAGNARLEQELQLIKQKLQFSRQQRTSPRQFVNPPETRENLHYLPPPPAPNPAFGADMDRVQKKIDDLQKQREELRLQVRQLADRSNLNQLVKQAPQLNMADVANLKKKPTSSWRETDLDTMNNIDHGFGDHSFGDHHDAHSLLYINTKHIEPPDPFQNPKTSDSTSEDTTYLSEKPEIKTVRIVKRESERRQRDREKISTGKCDSLVEEEIIHPPPPNYYYERSFCNSLPERSQVHKQKASELSPVFKSEAARQIITEMGKKPVQSQRRSVPREKRRHFTAPHDNSTAAVFGNLEERRARDDLDIERALRQRNDAPDIVRSTMGNKDFKYNEETIDSILSAPNKINIPERYIPEQSPQLSPEEQERRMKKVESIKKMLSDTAIISTGVPAASNDDNNSKNAGQAGKSSQSSFILEEKKQREHLLQLNQILAKQVMEISKVVAGYSEADYVS